MLRLPMRLPLLVFINLFTLNVYAATWYEATHLDLFAKSAQGNESPAHWLFTVPDQHNLSLEMDLRTPKVIKGKMMLILGRVILTQGLHTNASDVSSELEGPLLMYQLSIEVLQRAFPAGPDGMLKKHQVIKQENLKEAIVVKTKNATGRFDPPLQIQGMLNRKPDMSVDFELFFRFFRQGQAQELRLYGNWQKSRPSPRFAHTMKLDKWSLYSLDKTQYKKPNTLGELQRMILQAEAKP